MNLWLNYTHIRDDRHYFNFTSLLKGGYLPKPEVDDAADATISTKIWWTYTQVYLKAFSRFIISQYFICYAICIQSTWLLCRRGFNFVHSPKDRNTLLNIGPEESPSSTQFGGYRTSSSIDECWDIACSPKNRNREHWW